MRHFDFSSSFDTLDLPRDVTEILRATAHNKRLFNESQIHDDERYTTGSLRYDNENRPRAKFSDLESFPERLQTDRVEDIFRFFDFDRQASRFQLESWQTITDQLEHIRDATETTDRAAVVSAPTGFGKTPAFLGPAFHNAVLQNGDRTIIVYPSRALLKDQLGRILKTVHKVNNDPDFENDLSVGAWMGRQPYSKDDLVTDGRSFVEPGSPAKLKVASHWSDNQTTFYIARRSLPRVDPGYEVFDEVYRRTDGTDGIRFTEDELVLHRNAIKEDDSNDPRPDILLTTLESLEILAAKPHYDIVLNAEYFIFDEIHQYQGLRGSHAAQIIRNIRQIRDDNAVFLGASATVDTPSSFAESLFGFSSRAIEEYDEFEAGPNTVELLEPYESDIDDSSSDALHYYFMLTGQNQQPGVASQYLQHAMMIGRSLLQPDPTSQNDSEANDDEMSLLSLTDGSDARRKLLAFIQSKSQINRLKHQFENADKTRELWRYHDLGQPGDWRTLADRTDHEFLDTTDELDNPIAVYSGSEADVDDIDDADIIHGTSFLEVGIDIENLHFVSQYRPPENITTFKQRAGRAAREKDGSGHVFIHLSEFAGDSNFHYRADRFIQNNVTTPIWAENAVISWMHDRFHEYYHTLAEFRNESWYHGSWSDDSNAPELIKAYFTQELGWTAFTKFLLYPNSQFDEIYDIRTSGQNLLQSGENLDTIREKIEEKIRSIRDEYSDIQSVVDEDTGDLLLDQDAVTQFILEMSEAGIALHDDFTNTITDDSFDEARATLESVTDAPNPGDRVDEFLSALNKIKVSIESKRISLGPEAFPSDRLDRLDRAITVIQEAIGGGALERKARERRALYYLDQALDGIEEYREPWVANHGQLSAIKGLFRAAYYYNRSLKTLRNTQEFQLHQPPSEWEAGEAAESALPDEYVQIWYVPPNYFNDAGRYYTLEQPEFGDGDDYKLDEKPVTSMLSQFIPFKVEHKPDVGECQVFQPRVTTEDGQPKFDFSSIPGEDPTEDLRVPDRIRLDGVRDESGELAQGVFEFDMDNYKIKPAADGPTPASSSGGSTRPVKLFAEATIQSEVTATGDIDFESGNLQLCAADAKVWLEDILLQITEQVPLDDGDENEYVRVGDPEPHRIEASTPKLGYQLNTRTLTWDVSDFMAEYESGGGLDVDALGSGRRVPGDSEVRAAMYKRFDQVDPRETMYTTAAHLLTLLVADVTGVDPNLLLYGYDTDMQEIYVFEQTEGGQGIVDLFCEHQEQRPDLVLNSLYRLLHNPQILTERLWAHMPTVDRLYDEVEIEEFTRTGGDRAVAVEQIESIVTDVFGFSYPDSLSRVTEEVAASIDRMASLTTDEVSMEQLFHLKHELAAALVHNSQADNTTVRTDEIPADVHTEFEDTIETLGEESIRSLLLPKDIDSCQVNLQLDRSISDVPQDEALSYCILEQLEDYLVDAIPKSENREAMIERGAYWAWLDASNEEVFFVSW
ncbi:DEAD/DEAH box helicase [Halorientalis halophila]|uniref:DEAD/DEAH box helicase n=1 Tax=Halorientalis halophila TaxID=3108499 RepID=UPI00300B0AB8